MPGVTVASLLPLTSLAALTKLNCIRYNAEEERSEEVARIITKVSKVVDAACRAAVSTASCDPLCRSCQQSHCLCNISQSTRLPARYSYVLSRTLEILDGLSSVAPPETVEKDCMVCISPLLVSSTCATRLFKSGIIAA
jgi:hypothetical protein